MTTVAQTRDTRRDTVRQLAHDGMSLRAIAAKLGVSKDTVRRDLAQDGAPADETPATDATQASLTLPGAHPCAVEAIEALRDIDPDTLRQDERQLRDTRPYVIAVALRAAALLADTGPLDPLDRLSMRHLANQLRAVADTD